MTVSALSLIQSTIMAENLSAFVGPHFLSYRESRDLSQREVVKKYAQGLGILGALMGMAVDCAAKPSMIFGPLVGIPVGYGVGSIFNLNTQYSSLIGGAVGVLAVSAILKTPSIVLIGGALGFLGGGFLGMVKNKF